MKITYIHQYFNTPETGGSLRSYYLAMAMIDVGFEVSMITTHNAPSYKFENVEGIRVHYLPVAYDNRFGFYRRLISFLLFFIRASWLAFRLDSDLIYATSTPLSTGLTASLIRKLRKTPYIFEVRDLWPKAPIELGFIKNSWAVKILEYMEKTIYRRAISIVALSEPMRTYIEQRSPGKMIDVITNMSDISFFSENNREKLEEKRAKFNIGYIGSAGYVNNLRCLLQTAAYFSREHPGFAYFIIAAKGKELNDLKQYAQAEGLKNVRFMDYQNREGLRRLLRTLDFTYLSFLPHPVLETSSPNKLFDSLAAGIPVISNSDGWWVDELEQRKCGLHYSSDRPEDLYTNLTEIASNPSALTDMKANAQALAKEKYSREQRGSHLIAHIRNSYANYLRGL